MDEAQDAAPPPAAREYTATNDGLLTDLRVRLQTLNGGQPLKLPVPPMLPDPAAEDALRARGEAQNRAMALPELDGDSFLRAAARELGVDEDAYRLAQRPAVVGALDVCTQSSVTKALDALAGWPRNSAAWAQSMRRPATPFDALALMLWSLLNATSVLVRGHEPADDVEFCAPIYLPEEPYEGLTVGLLETAPDNDDTSGDQLLSTAFAGFVPFKRVLAEVVPRNATGILDFGKLSGAALNNSEAAKRWIGMPRWKQKPGETAKRWHGNVFIIGDGFKSTYMFRGSVNPLEKCLHRSTVSTAADGQPIFTVTAEDRPDSPLSSVKLGEPWRLCGERAKRALEALPPEERSGVKLGKSDWNGKRNFRFTTSEFFRSQESKIDPNHRFALYWETKQLVADGTAPVGLTGVRRGRAAAAEASGGSGGAAGGDDGGAPVQRRARQRRRLAADLAAAGDVRVAGDGMRPEPERQAPRRPSAAEVIDLTLDEDDDDDVSSSAGFMMMN